MALPPIPAMPPAPQRTQAGDDFALTADTFVAAMGLMPAQYNALSAAMEQLVEEIATQGFTATSTTSMAIGTGIKTFTASTGAAFVQGQTVIVSATGYPGNNMSGALNGYDRVTGEMQVEVSSINGSGTFNNWAISLTVAVDLSGYLLKSGGTMTGQLILPASITSRAPINIPHGIAPTSPVSGDWWTTTAGVFARISTITRQLATLDGTETFASKTLTSPTINTPVVNAGTFTGYTEKQATAVTGSALSPNLANGTIFPLITNANATITLPSPAIGKSFFIPVQYGGAHTLTWAGGARKWADATVPTPTSVSGKTDVFTFVSDYNGSNWLAFTSGQNL